MRKVLYCLYACVLTATICFSHLLRPASMQGQSRNVFTSRDEYFAAHKNQVIARMGLEALDPREEIDRMIQQEMDTLDRVAGFRTIVTKGDDDQISSHPETGIVVSPQQLDLIKQRSGVRKFQQILRFLLAHEKSHQVQYLNYTAQSVHLGPLELRRVYECQADMLAGKYLIESFGEPSAEDRMAIEDALTVAFDLGSEKFVESSDHPDHEARRVAVRLGMSSGIITLLSKRLPDPPAVEITNSLAGKINIREGETVMGWSLRLSKKITHYTLEANSDISLEDADVNWDRSASHAFVSFDLTYKNEGEKTIKVDMEVQCLAVRRNASSDSKYWQKWSNRNYIFRLAPGETYHVRGRLPWYADTESMPRLVYPPQNSALRNAEYVSTN